MKICVVTEGRKNFSVRLPACDVALFGFSTLGMVDYESELSGKTDKFESMARLSGAARCGVFCGCLTDSRGLKRKSVAVACCGKLLGISDMLCVLDGEDYKSGASVGIYHIGGYRVGVCIDNDLRFPDCIKTCADCGCNLIVAFLEDASDGMTPLLIRSYAYVYGIPVVLSCGRVAFFSDVTGVLASSNCDVAVFETSPKNRYRTVTLRKRGLWGGGADDC